MPCLFVLLALAMPRIFVIGLWLFSNWFRGVFSTSLWPIVGFFFLPTTLLWYTAVQHWFGGQWTLWPIVGLVVALSIDVSPAGGKRSRKQ
ncbi:MAG TPA: hypothetical protein VF332_13660 [Vicinamibacterales bacterium]|jgi:hypothetical protein